MVQALACKLQVFGAFGFGEVEGGDDGEEAVFFVFVVEDGLGDLEFFEPFGDPGFEAEHEGGDDRTELWIEFGEDRDYHVVDLGVDGDGFQGLDNVDGEVNQLLGFGVEGVVKVVGFFVEAGKEGD